MVLLNAASVTIFGHSALIHIVIPSLTEIEVVGSISSGIGPKENIMIHHSFIVEGIDRCDCWDSIFDVDVITALLIHIYFTTCSWPMIWDLLVEFTYRVYSSFLPRSWSPCKLITWTASNVPGWILAWLSPSAW